MGFYRERSLEPTQVRLGSKAVAWDLFIQKLQTDAPLLEWDICSQSLSPLSPFQGYKLESEFIFELFRS
jgi:hypothetical protein